MKTLILNLTLATAATLASLAPAADAQAASDYLLELDGIKGESSVRASITQFRWTQALAGPTFDPFHPAFAGGVRVATGDLDGDGLWSLLSLTARVAGDAIPIFEYAIPDARVGVLPNPPGSHGEWIVIESMTSPVLRYRPLLPGGGRGAPISGGWTTNGAFVGDAGVFAAFAELGAEQWADGTLVVTGAVPEPATWALALLGVATLVHRRRRAPAAAAA